MKGNIFVDESVKAKGRPRNMLSVPVLREGGCLPEQSFDEELMIENTGKGTVCS